VLGGLGGSGPHVNVPFLFEVTSAAPLAPGFVALGFTELPGFDLGVIGMPGCPLRTDIVLAG
jgi:hypothetical protein